MSLKEVLYGVGGVLVGLAGGVGIGGAVSEGKMQDAITRAMAPGQTASAEASGDTLAALAGLEAQLAALKETVAGAQVDQAALGQSISEGVSQAVAEDLAGVQSALTEQIDAASAAQEAAVAELSGGLEESARIAAAAVATASGLGAGMPVGTVADDTGAQAAAETAPQAVVSGAAEVSGPLSVGQTAVFADGKLRVFVSRLDTQAGAARLMANGGFVELGSGGTTVVSLDGAPCQVSVMALSEEGATLASDCAQSAGAEAVAQAPAAKVSADAPENGILPGRTALLADGKLRVFVSAVDDVTGAARIAVNGVQTVSLSVGDTTEAKAGDAQCSVTLAAVGQGQAAVTGACN